MYNSSIQCKQIIPPKKYTVTVLDVCSAHSAADHREQVRRYAQIVWQAYTSQHDLARRWIQAALEKKW